MTRLLAALLAPALLAATSLAQPQITKEQFVANDDNGYCAWCCLEMVCLNVGHDNIKGLTARRHRTYILHPNGTMTLTAGRASVSELSSELTHQKIKHSTQDIGNRDTDIIKKAIAKKLPIVISVRNYPSVGDHHAVVLTDLTDTTASIVDPNLNNKTIDKARDWFDKTWTGYTVVVQAKEPSPAVSEPPRIPPALPSGGTQRYEYALPPSIGWTGTPSTTGGRVIRP